MAPDVPTTDSASFSMETQTKVTCFDILQQYNVTQTRNYQVHFQFSQWNAATGKKKKNRLEAHMAGDFNRSQ